jgi:RNA polymerase sigma-70 factor (ECF subfamily)
MDETHLLQADSLTFAPEDLERRTLTAERVYRDYAPRVYNMARRMVSNEKDAEDVTQEVFLQVVRKLPTFRGESAFPTWLHRVTINAALAHRRKQAAREDLHVANPLEDLLDQGQWPGSDRIGLGPPEEQLIDHEERQLIDRAIAGLPAIYRAVLVLSDLDGLPNAETAERLGLTVPAVKSRLHRARLLLRARLAPHFEELPI